MKNIVIRALLLLSILALAGCAGSNTQNLRSGDARAVITTGTLPAPDSTTDSGAYSGLPDYRIGPLDLIQISVFQLESMDREVRVNSSGMISLPLIGAVTAGGKTVPELEREIAASLSEEFLQNPQVSVFVKEYTSQRITVEGAVVKPGIFPITGKTTLLQAIAMTEGLHELADPSAVVVFRTIDGQRMAALFDLRQIRAGNGEDPQLYGDDIIVVDRSGPRTAFKAVVDTLRGFIGFQRF